MSSETDRVKSGLFKVIQKLLTMFIVNSIDHLASYQCKVISQNSDGTLELRPDDSRLPPYSKVPIRYGVPKVSATVNAGARILLEFAGGNPQRPIATLWELDSISTLRIGSGMNLAIVVNNYSIESSNQEVILDGGEIQFENGLVVFNSNTTVTLPDGTQNVNRVNDPVHSATLMTTWMGQVTAAINTLAPGSIAPPAPSTIGLTAGGNPKVSA